MHLVATVVQGFTEWTYPPHLSIDLDFNEWNETCDANQPFTTETTILIIHHNNKSTEGATTCPAMILMWWSAAAIIISIFLIEYDRFLAIRYPLLYPEMVTDERSILASLACQIGCLCCVMVLRHFAPMAFVCEFMYGDIVEQVI